MSNLLDRVTDSPNEAYITALMAAQESYYEVNGYYPADSSRPGTWYLAGPMSGLPQFNFPQFDEASRVLRQDGWVILSPAEMDDQTERGYALESPDGRSSRTNKPRAHFLKRDFLIVMEVSGIIVLPGWHLSSGARDETRLAHALDKPVLGVYPSLEQIDVHPYISAGMDLDRFEALWPDAVR